LKKEWKGFLRPKERGTKTRKERNEMMVLHILLVKTKDPSPSPQSREPAWGVVFVAAFLLDVVTVQPCGGCGLHQPHFCARQLDATVYVPLLQRTR
jgi:hypothetical protein